MNCTIKVNAGLRQVMFGFRVLCVSVIIAFVASSCMNKCVDEESLYGCWNGYDSLSKSSIRLDIRPDCKALISFPDTFGQVAYHIYKLSDDSLLLKDINNNILSYRIVVDTVTRLEFLYDKMNIVFNLHKWKNNPYDDFEMPNVPVDSLNFIFDACNPIDYRKSLTEDSISISGVNLSERQVKKTLELLQYIADRDSVSLDHAFRVDRLYPMNWYYRQFIGYKNKEKHLIVEVYFYFIRHPLFETGEKEYNETIPFIHIRDGGELFARAEVDLTIGKVIIFKTNGDA